MALNFKSTTQLVRGYAAAVQASASTALSFVLGSIELARANAVAAIAMWLQTLVMQVLALTRASTSVAGDLDTWLAQFNIVTRKAAIQAQGSVTLSRFTTTAQALVPVGGIVQSSDGTQQFTIIADTTQAAYNSTLLAYVLPVGTASITATVQAVNAGTQGNVNANTITQIASSMPVDSVNNAMAFTSGANAESDTAVLLRFQQELQGLKQGTKAAIESAIGALQLGIQYEVVENQTLAGATQNGFFYAIISPFSSTLQSQVYAAIDAVRALSVTFAVYAATQVTATVSLTVTAAAGYTHTNVAAAVQTAITNFIGTIPLGAPLPYSQLYYIVWGVPGVADATSLLLNSGTADLTVTASESVVAGAVTVN